MGLKALLVLRTFPRFHFDLEMEYGADFSV
jgi:hypothetical protein